MTTPQEADIRMALYHLRMAREFAKSAGAPKTTDAIRRAMKSAEGAQRHASRGDIREKRADKFGPKGDGLTPARELFRSKSQLSCERWARKNRKGYSIGFNEADGLFRVFDR